MTKSVSAAVLAASLVFGVSAMSLGQNAPPAGGAGANMPSNATGSGKDTGMQIPSGMSGNGPGGVGTAASPNAAGASAGKTGAAKPKSAKHSKKHTASSTSTSH